MTPTCQLQIGMDFLYLFLEEKELFQGHESSLYFFWQENKLPLFEEPFKILKIYVRGKNYTFTDCGNSLIQFCV